MVYVVYNIIPCNKIWGGEYIIWFERYIMGFKTLHGKQTIDIESISNYRFVGFGMVVDTKLASLMHLGFWGSPILGLSSMNVWVISLGLWRLWSHLCAMKEETPWGMKVRFVWILCLCLGLFCGSFIAILLILVVFSCICR